MSIYYDSFLYHHGIKGQKWGVRRYQNPDGSLTPAGMKRYAKDVSKQLNKLDKQRVNQLYEAGKYRQQYASYDKKIKALKKKIKKENQKFNGPNQNKIDVYNSKINTYNLKADPHRKRYESKMKEVQDTINKGRELFDSIPKDSYDIKVKDCMRTPSKARGEALVATFISASIGSATGTGYVMFLPTDIPGQKFKVKKKKSVAKDPDQKFKDYEKSKEKSEDDEQLEIAKDILKSSKDPEEIEVVNEIIESINKKRKK